MQNAGLNSCIAGVARNLYYNGYDSDPELMGAALKKIAKKIVSKVKKIKKGGLSVTTGKGTMSYSQPSKAEIVPVMPESGFAEKLKDPKVLAGIGVGVIAIYFLTKKKRKGKK
jgi:hypothetical protein